MLAYTYLAPGAFQLLDKPKPALRDDRDAIVRVTVSSISTSDLHIKHGSVPRAVPGVTVGHEMVGVVEEVGSAVSSVRPGDRVTVNVETFCGSCFFCQHGWVNNCTDPEGGWALGCRIDGGQAEYESLEGAYAFVMNHRGPSGQEITDSQIYETCNRGLEELKTLGILPESVRPVEKDEYDAVLYSAIDVLEPRNNVAVWKLSLINSQKNTDKENRLMEAYIDGDNGRIYEFYARSSRLWDDMDPEQIVGTWSSYMGLEKPAAFGDQNPLMEATPYFEKYVISQGEEEETIVTVGFYEGINELFLKISR